MATNAKRGLPEYIETSMLEVLRAKIKKLEQKNLKLEAKVNLKANAEEFQVISDDQVGQHTQIGGMHSRPHTGCGCYGGG